MKKKMFLSFLVLVLAMSVFVGCGSKADNVSDNAEITNEAPTTTAEPTVNPEITEATHEHAYIETITTEATCETDGEKTFTCECGDTYTEPIATQGHVFETYTSNNDATYIGDGTETAKCNNCEVTDTRTAEGSMLTYTYTDMDTTMYAQQTVNVRSMPNSDGEKLGTLDTNDEVKVTGQCAETSWYRIEYSGGVAYVSDSYLGNDKIVVEQPKAEQTQNVTLNTYAEARAYAISLGYPIGQAVDNGNGTAYCYNIGHPNSPLYGEDSALHSADVDSARDCAEMFFTHLSYFYHDENGGKHIVKLGNGWTVYRFTYTPRPDLAW